MYRYIEIVIASKKQQKIVQVRALHGNSLRMQLRKIRFFDKIQYFLVTLYDYFAPVSIRNSLYVYRKKEGVDKVQGLLLLQ